MIEFGGYYFLLYRTETRGLGSVYVLSERGRVMSTGVHVVAAVGTKSPSIEILFTTPVTLTILFTIESLRDLFNYTKR